MSKVPFRPALKYDEILEKLDKGFQNLSVPSTTHLKFQALARELLLFFIPKSELDDIWRDLGEVHLYAERATTAFLAMHGARLWNMSDEKVAKTDHIKTNTRTYFVFLLQSMTKVEKGKMSDGEFDGRRKGEKRTYKDLRDELVRAMSKTKIHETRPPLKPRALSASGELPSGHLRRTTEPTQSEPSEQKSFEPCPFCEAVIGDVEATTYHIEKEHLEG